MSVRTFAVLMALPICAMAADAKPAAKQPQAETEAASIEFLEYLGSLESEDDNWTDFEAVVETKQPTKQADTQRKTPAATEKSK